MRYREVFLNTLARWYLSISLLNHDERVDRQNYMDLVPRSLESHFRNVFLHVQLANTVDEYLLCASSFQTLTSTGKNTYTDDSNNLCMGRTYQDKRNRPHLRLGLPQYFLYTYI